MLQVNQSSGDTVQFNMEVDADRDRWERLSPDPAFQGTITGAAILWGGRQYVAPRPAHFHSICYEHELVVSRDGATVTGERIIIQADMARITFTVWRGQNGSCKVDVERLGRRVLTPGAAGMPRGLARGISLDDDMGADARHAGGGTPVADGPPTLVRRTG